SPDTKEMLSGAVGSTLSERVPVRLIMSGPPCRSRPGPGVVEHRRGPSLFLTLDYITCSDLSTTLDSGHDPVHPQRGPHRRPGRGRDLGAGPAEQRQHLPAPLR